MLEVSEGGRAVLMGVAVGVALPLDLRRSFSAFSVSISFCLMTKKRENSHRNCITDSSDAVSNSVLNRQFPAFRLVHCCYSESVLLELRAESNVLIFKALFVLKGKSQIRSLYMIPRSERRL